MNELTPAQWTILEQKISACLGRIIRSGTCEIVEDVFKRVCVSIHKAFDDGKTIDDILRMTPKIVLRHYLDLRRARQRAYRKGRPASDRLPDIECFGGIPQVDARDALEVLPPLQREVTEAVYLHEMPYREVATRFGVPRCRIPALLAQAREILRRAIS